MIKECRIITRIPLLILKGLFIVFAISCNKENVPVYTLSLNINPSGTGEAIGANQYPAGEVVSVTAAPIENYRFMTWTGDTNYIADAKTASSSVTMPDRDISLMANFKEKSEIIYGDGVTDADGNEYTTVIIGTQEWMAENLRTSVYADGSAIPTDLNNSEWDSTNNGAYAIFPYSELEGLNSDAEVVEAYGKLYNWYAVDNAHGLCPAGWRVPTDADWTVLTNYVVEQGFPNDWSNPIGAANALKSCRQLSHPDGGDCETSEHPRWYSFSASGFDEFGFSALPGDFRWYHGNFGIGGMTGYWWSSTESSATHAYLRTLYSDYDNIYESNNLMNFGLSVRCLRDIDFHKTTND